MVKRRSGDVVWRMDALPSHHRLEHGVEAADLARLGRIRRRRQLERDGLFGRLRPEIEEAIGGFEWAPVPSGVASASERLRCVAWNIERGKRFAPLVESLTSDPALASADLLLLTEVDKGMGRSGNRDVARELAELMGMGYVFVNHHLVLCKGDSGEQDHDEPNTWSMHGSALLSRYPIRRFTSVALPEYLDKFHAFEKRLGCKRALICEVELPDGPMTVVVAHLDPFAPPRHRVYQMGLIAEAVARFGGRRVLLGGDLNTNTYDLSKGPTLMAGMLYKISRFGVEGTIEHYLEPERRFERRLFDLMGEVGFEVEPYNAPACGTLFCDTRDPELKEKALAYVPASIYARIERMLEPWDGVIPVRLDWFAGHGLEPVAPEVLMHPDWRRRPISDHMPVAVELALTPEAAGGGQGIRRPPVKRRRLPVLKRPRRAVIV